MNKRSLFAEIHNGLEEAKLHSEGKLTLKSHALDTQIPLTINPDEIRNIRREFNMSRGVFAQYLNTSTRTLENWEQGRSKPNEQAITLLKLVKNHPDTLELIASL